MVLSCTALFPIETIAIDIPTLWTTAMVSGVISAVVVVNFFF